MTAARLAAAFRASASEALQRFWMMTRFGCYVTVFYDHVAEATLVRRARRRLLQVR